MVKLERKQISPRLRLNQYATGSRIVRIAAIGFVMLLGSAIVLHQKLPATPTRRHFRHSKPRIAVLLPLSGESPPPYLSAFCWGTRAASSVADFYIIHTGILQNVTDCSENVFMVDYQSTKGLAQHLVKVVDDVKDEELKIPRDRLIEVISRQIHDIPYALVEWKMALGYVFQDILERDGNKPRYSHWAYSDLDIVFGDLQRWITVDEWDFHIVTYGFRDLHRL